MSSRRGRYRAEKYPWLLTADPPVCRTGPALAVLQRCEPVRRGEQCLCRFVAADLAADLERVGATSLAEYFATGLEPEDVEELAAKVCALDLSAIDDPDAVDSVTSLCARLTRLVRAEAGLTDRYSDDID